jgi:hypothetical protein
MFRNIAFTVLFAFANLAHAQTESVASPATQIVLPDLGDSASKLIEPKRQVTLQLPGFSHHFQKPVHKDGSPVVGRDYNERNWGLGAQFEDPVKTEGWEQWVRKASFGLMKDSLDTWGPYAGVIWQRRVVNNESISADLGGGGFLFYRAVQFDGKRTVVPALLPVVSMVHKPTGLGANLVYVPTVHTKNGRMSSVMYLQFTKEF